MYYKNTVETNSLSAFSSVQSLLDIIKINTCMSHKKKKKIKERHPFVHTSPNFKYIILNKD